MSKLIKIELTELQRVRLLHLLEAVIDNSSYPKTIQNVLNKLRKYEDDDERVLEQIKRSVLK